jgi:hypothetical protein
MQETAVKVKKVSLNWAKLIARIYEANPLVCTGCGKEIKIVAFVTHAAEIRRILSNINWPLKPPEFEPPYDLFSCDICQLVPGTKDGFPETEEQFYCDVGPDPPHWEELCDPPHQDYSDPSHSED